MKKLMALIVIIMIATSYILVAEAVENPFKFSLYNQIKLKGVDESQMGRITDDNSSISYAPDYDFVVTKAVINDEMQCKAAITIAEIYTMGFYLLGSCEIGTGGDSERVVFKVGMENGIQAVKDYLKIDINVALENHWRDDAVDRVSYFLKPYVGFSGKIPDTGISWSLSEAIEMGFNPENWKDTDPTYQSWDGPAYNSADGERIDFGAPWDDSDQVGAFEYAKFESKVTFDFEFFHFFAPENITGTLKLMNNFKVKLPYSYYLEVDKVLNDEFEAGFEAGLAGPKVYVALWGETEDKLNTSAPLDGDLGSNRDWSGDWVGDEVTGDWSDSDAVKHGRPNLKLGFKINFSYSKEWFSFGTGYKAYETGLRRYDEDGLNDQLKWVNEFEIYAKFAL